MNKPEILIVEDDKAIKNLISTTLEMDGYHFHTAENGAQAILSAATQQPAVMLLDLGLPDIDGTDVIRKVRTWSQMPIIVISARNEDRDKIDALDAGADDYLTKPFSVEELRARLRATLRRLNYLEGLREEENSRFTNGGLVIDFAGGFATLDGKELRLTPFEYKLLCLLARHVGKVLTHAYITKEIWGSSWDGDVASLRVFMASLRKKIEADPSQPQYIQTHVGVGYRMIRRD